MLFPDDTKEVHLVPCRVNIQVSKSRTLPAEFSLTVDEIAHFKAKVHVTEEQRAFHDPPIDVAELPQLKQLHAPRPFARR